MTADTTAAGNLPAASSILLYTMTSGLGDCLVMGDLARKANSLFPGARCAIIHRGNPHVHLWSEELPGATFFDLYRLPQFLSLVRLLKKERAAGAKVFGFQMAPGSLQGYLFLTLLKRLSAMDFVVDFNLINADIITPPEGDYILDLHLNQLSRLFRHPLTAEEKRLALPKALARAASPDGQLVGLHPWSRRKNERLSWPRAQWMELIAELLARGKTPLLFGRDDDFASLQRELEGRFGAGRILFRPSSNVGELVETIAGLSLLISVNTSVIHIAHALKVPAVVLSGPHLGLWTPKGEDVFEVRDPLASYPPSDESKADPGMPNVSRIPFAAVWSAVSQLL
ncbi:MAG TPA: glycosyltransferase family 9 protein [Geomonas sp.]|nr:glycosyltransferase family 9 protein [Geomonas sp.]